jgi:hypothetical protein
MQDPVITGTQDHNILEQIREGMHVHDVDDKSIGTIDHLFLGEATPKEQEEGTGPATISRKLLTPEEELDNFLAKAFGKADLPQVVRSRLLENGFFHVRGGGLLPTDRFVMPNQIGSISGDQVKLNVRADDLIK